MTATGPVPVPTFATGRLTLRPLRVADADPLHALYSDEAAMTYWSHAPLADLAATRAMLTDRLAKTDWQTWAITRTGHDAAIGTVGANEKRQGGVSEIGYSLVRAAWGQGYAREAVAGLIDRLFAEGQRRVFADTDPGNVASNALLAALGFQREGLLRGEWDTHIGVRDSLIWGLLRDEWISVRPIPPPG